ncbi:MarR family transcriptional regulator [Ralstonia pickettii]|uniref:hypothetical protein n=1 Tax=Ralstonia pickettii TaxID=329 RepID=UPI002714A344|nr:hypothetical protein [Ralstonia pickettii]WKZ86330.1 MarR family transcriptional regulator [Ralstonia pickettii]
MHLTVKQIELMRVIGAGNPDGSPADLDQVLERLNYETTKSSIQFSIRALIKHGLIEKGGREKRRGRQRVLLLITSAGSMHVRPTGVIGAAAVAVSEEQDQVEQSLSALAQEEFVDAPAEFLEP